MIQFSLRHLLLFDAVVASFLGWLLYRLPAEQGTEVHISNGHALTYDAVTGRVWHESNPDDGSPADDSDKLGD